MYTFRSFLTEKLIVVGNGAKYGQIIFLAGGAGSGKGFATSNFLEGSKFKVRDVDEWKKMFLKIAFLKNKYSEIRRLDLRKPKDVGKLHEFIKNKGVKDKTLNLMLAQAKIGRLPNIIFDITLKDKEDIIEVLPQLFAIGYNPRNINVVWVLTDYHIAVQQNKDPKRGRIVPDDILLKTHEGAAGTMWKFINSGTPRGVNGGVYVILGGAKHTIFYTDPKTGKPYDGREGRTIVKDFKYLTLKEPGKRMTKEAGLKDEVFSWIRSTAPKTKKTKEIWGSGQDKLKEGEVPLPQLYIDMDQVLVDFLSGAKKILGEDYTDKHYWKREDAPNKKQELDKNAPNFFRELNWMEDGKKLWNFIQEYQPKILSACPRSWAPNAKEDKHTWVENNLGIDSSDVHLVNRHVKRKYAISEYGQPNVLIDDNPKNISEWQSAGGIGILHVNTASTIKKLKKMGFNN